MSLSNISFVRWTLALLGAGLVVLVLAAGASVWLAEQTREDAVEVLNAQRLRTRTSHLLTLLLDAETGQRGFLLTQDPVYLEPYNAARAQVVADLAELETLERANPQRAAIVGELAAAVRDKFAELERTVSLTRSGQIAEALQVVNTDRGRELMDIARHKIGDLLSLADARLADRVQEMRTGARLLSYATIVGGLLVFLLGVGSVFIVLRYTRDLERAQNEVQRLNETLEERVQERTTDLARANDEIQRFAYIVSHDLRAPLVNVMGFTSELEANVATVGRFIDELDVDETNTAAHEAKLAIKEDMPEAIGFIRSSTSRMDRLINAILKLSREGRRNLKPERVDLGDLLDSLAANVQHQVSEAGGEIDVKRPMPTLVSDRIALEQIFGNLLDNAVKYRHPNRPLHIAVRAVDAGRQVHFEIEDNGRGIAKQDHERIFDLFRRSGVQDVPGEGIGLAHVRALSRRLGGDITVNSELGVGTTFRVSLPRVLRQQAVESVAS